MQTCMSKNIVNCNSVTSVATDVVHKFCIITLHYHVLWRSERMPLPGAESPYYDIASESWPGHGRGGSIYCGQSALKLKVNMLHQYAELFTYMCYCCVMIEIRMNPSSAEKMKLK